MEGEGTHTQGEEEAKVEIATGDGGARVEAADNTVNHGVFAEEIGLSRATIGVSAERGATMGGSG